MSGIDPGVVLAGLIAYLVAVLASATLVFLTYRFNTVVTSRVDEERLLLSGHRSIAVTLGTVLLSQAMPGSRAPSRSTSVWFAPSSCGSGDSCCAAVSARSTTSDW